MTAITKSTLVQATERQMSADLAGETVLLNYEDGVYYSLNPVGARIWELIQDTKSVQDVLATLLDEYDTDPSACEADLLELLGEMTGLGLVEIRDGNS
jgi:Coenzyme PQQ synthesis protein D (PqqD)